MRCAYCGGGEILRAYAGSDAVRAPEVAAALSAHEDVDPLLTYDALDDHLSRDAGGVEGVVLDGFPKALAHWDLFAKRYGVGRIDAALLVQVPIEVAIDRQRMRLVCGDCDASHRSSTSDAGETPCQRSGCSGILLRREDDQPGAIEERQADVEFALLAQRFAELEQLIVLDGAGQDTEILARALDSLGAGHDEMARHSGEFLRSLRQAS